MCVCIRPCGMLPSTHWPRQRIRDGFSATAQETQILGHIFIWYHSLEESCWPVVGQHAKTLVCSAQCTTGSYWKDHSTALSFLLFLTILTRDQAPAGPQLLIYHQTSMCGPDAPEFRAISIVVTALSIACSDTSAGWGVLLEWRNLPPKPGLFILW